MSVAPPEIKKVVVHPLVLLSVVDHFNRIRNQRRVVGILLGHWQKNGSVDVSNSFARKFIALSKLYSNTLNVLKG